MINLKLKKQNRIIQYNDSLLHFTISMWANLANNLV